VGIYEDYALRAKTTTRKLEGKMWDLEDAVIHVQYAFEGAAQAIRDYDRAARARQPVPPMGGPPEGHQYGGSVGAGRPVTVGEAGPETFVPESSGYIVPNPSTVSNMYHNTTSTTNVNTPVNATINSGMDLAALASVLEQTIVGLLE